VRRKVSPPFCKPDADDAPVKSLILNASDPFYASTSSLMDCDSTFQAQRLFLHQICWTSSHSIKANISSSDSHVWSISEYESFKP
jgi:hypothetical protein